MYSDTFNISHIISQFTRYSLESGNKIWQELLLNCLNKWILIISDNCYYDNIYTTINNLLKNYQAMFFFFCLICKKVALEIKEKTLKQNMVRSKCNFWSKILYILLVALHCNNISGAVVA